MKRRCARRAVGWCSVRCCLKAGEGQWLPRGTRCPSPAFKQQLNRLANLALILHRGSIHLIPYGNSTAALVGLTRLLACRHVLLYCNSRVLSEWVLSAQCNGYTMSCLFAAGVWVALQLLLQPWSGPMGHHRALKNRVALGTSVAYSLKNRMLVTKAGSGSLLAGQYVITGYLHILNYSRRDVKRLLLVPWLLYGIAQGTC